jgi:hypothetical protein
MLIIKGETQIFTIIVYTAIIICKYIQTLTSLSKFYYYKSLSQLRHFLETQLLNNNVANDTSRKQYINIFLESRMENSCLAFGKSQRLLDEMWFVHWFCTYKRIRGGMCIVQVVYSQPYLYTELHASTTITVSFLVVAPNTCSFCTMLNFFALKPFNPNPVCIKHVLRPNV